ncbi:MAG: type II secretion system protein [Dehalococcoidia bacterium]
MLFPGSAKKALPPLAAKESFSRLRPDISGLGPPALKCIRADVIGPYPLQRSPAQQVAIAETRPLIDLGIRAKKGFSLVELMVVLSIIAVLVGIVALGLSGFIGSGEATACDADQRSLQSAVGAYWADNESWPTQDGNAPGDLFDASEPLVTDDFILEVPRTDASADWGIDADGVVEPTAPATCP